MNIANTYRFDYFDKKDQNKIESKNRKMVRSELLKYQNVRTSEVCQKYIKFTPEQVALAHKIQKSIKHDHKTGSFGFSDSNYRSQMDFMKETTRRQTDTFGTRV